MVPFRPLVELLCLKRLAWTWGVHIHYYHLPFMVMSTIDRIRQYVNTRKYMEAREFLNELDPDTRRLPRVALEAGRLLWIQGLFSHAICVLQYSRPLNVDSRSYFHASDDPQDTILTAMTILSACVAFAADANATHALRLLAAFDDWRRDLNLDDAAAHFKIVGLDGLRMQCPVVGPNMSSVSVYIIRWCCVLALKLAHQGLLDDDEIKVAVNRRITSLEKVLQLEGRAEEELVVIELRLEHKIFLDSYDPVAALESLLSRIDEDTDGGPLLKANALRDLGTAHIQKHGEPDYEMAHSLYEQAQVLFRAEGQRSAEIRIDHILLHDQFSSQESPQISGAEIEKFKKLWSLSEAYEEVDDIDGQLVVLEDIGVSVKMDAIENLQNEISSWSTKLDEVLVTTGGKYTRQLAYVASFSNLCRNFRERDMVRWMLMRFYDDPPCEELPNHRGAMAGMISTLFGQLMDPEKACLYAKKAFDHYKSGKSFVKTSQSVSCLANAKIKRALDQVTRGEKTAGLQDIQVAENLLQEWAELDKEHNNLSGQQQKYVDLASLEFIRHCQFEAVDALQNGMGYVEQASQISIARLGYIEESVQTIKFYLLVLQNELESAMECAGDEIMFWEDRLRQMPTVMHKFHSACSKAHWAEVAGIIVNNQYAALTVSPEALNDLSDSQKADWMELHEGAKTMLTTAFCGIDSAVNLIMEVGMEEGRLGWVVQLVDIVWKLKGLSPEGDPRRFYGEIIHHVSLAERTYVELRASLNALDPLESILKKQQFISSNKDWYSMYSSAVVAFLGLSKHEEVWEWVQKAKWRSSGDIQGPSQHLLHAQLQKEAHHLLLQEQKLVELGRQASTSRAMETLDLRRQLEQHRQNMGSDSNFAMEHPEKYYHLGQQDWLFINETNSWVAPKKVVFVDWFIPTESIDNKIYMAVRYSTGECFTHTLAIELSFIRQWMSKNLVFSSFSDSPLKEKNGNKLLKKLNALVAPLASLTDPDDVVVLCPSGILHNFPIHALDVDRQPLILRNLVVYSPSLKDFRDCLMRAKESLNIDVDQNSTRSAFFGIYEDIDIDNELVAHASTAEKEQIYRSIRDISNEAQGMVLTGTSVNPISFKAAVENKDWVHYHGHVRFSETDILEQAMVLSPAEAQPTIQSETESTTDDQPRSSAPGDFTISDVFKLSVKSPAPVFILIGCESGMQRITDGDELLGITTAFMFVGAASTLGCLWPIPSSVGRFFSQKFYESLLRQSRQDFGQSQPASSILPFGALNLALATRDAVRAIRERPEKDMSVAYYWAAFALQGAWFTRNIFSPWEGG